MTIRLPLFLVLTVLWTLSACNAQRMAPYVDLGDQLTNVDELRALAEQGDVEEQYRLGVRYERGLRVPQNYQEAIRWYRMAALQRHADALYKLCEMSDIGRGVPQDYQEALRWCRLAADQGQGHAMFTLGVYYHAARGVPRDLLQAHKWYNLAAAFGYDEGAKRRDRLAYDMPPNRIAEAQKLARDWKPAAPLPVE